MMPLVNAFLATIFLGEKLRPAHYPALALVAVGVAVPFVAAGDFTWLAVAAAGHVRVLRAGPQAGRRSTA